MKNGHQVTLHHYDIDLLHYIKNRPEISPDELDHMILDFVNREYKKEPAHLSILKSSMTSVVFILVNYPNDTCDDKKEMIYETFVLEIQKSQQLTELISQFYHTVLSLCPVSVQTQSDTKVVERAMCMIEEQYDQAILLKDIARDLYISSSYLSKMIKEEYGKNFIEILTDVRLKHAKELLLTTSLQVKEIAERTGFSNYIYFYKIFKKKEGTSPQEYRSEFSFYPEYHFHAV